MTIKDLFLELYEEYIVGDIKFRHKADFIDCLDFAYATWNEGELYESAKDCYNCWLAQTKMYMF